MLVRYKIKDSFISTGVLLTVKGVVDSKYEREGEKRSSNL